MKNKARKVYSEDEYQQLLDERPVYIGDLQLKHRKCPSKGCGLDHQTIQHFDIIKIKKIDDQINAMLKKANRKLIEHDHDNDDQTSEM